MRGDAYAANLPVGRSDRQRTSPSVAQRRRAPLNARMLVPVLSPVRAPFRALATTFVPEAAALTESDWAEVEAIVEQALALRPPGIRRQLATLIKLLELLPLLRYARRFTALDAGRRTRFLAAFQRSPLLLLRRGVWGLRTLVFMGYYARPAAGAAIGYRADARGWEARRP